METMKAVIFDGSLRYVENYPLPEMKAGWARIMVQSAGICKTDLEIMKGYMGYKGVLGHEFVGVVESCQDEAWAGKRVVGDINAACGRCDWCTRGLGHHCPNRTTLGIDGLDGCMAEYCVLPVENLFIVEPDISHDRAVLTEPLAAACEVLDQLALTGSERTIVLKSTVANQGGINLAPIVVNEITVVGSRCGSFPDALKMMRDVSDMPLERLVTGRYPLHAADQAFAEARSGRALKVLLEIE